MSRCQVGSESDNVSEVLAITSGGISCDDDGGRDREAEVCYG